MTSLPLSTEKIDELRACPFCGSSNVETNGSMSWTFVRCIDCKAQGATIHHGGPTTDRAILNRCEVEAIAAWNRRSPPVVHAAEPVAWTDKNGLEFLARGYGIDVSAEAGTTGRTIPLYVRPPQGDGHSVGVKGLTFEERVEAALHARIPGGSEAWHWIAGGGMRIEAIHRDVMRAALTSALAHPGKGGEKNG